LSAKLIQFDQYPYKKKKSRQRDIRDAEAQRRSHVRTQLEGCHLQVRKRALHRN
jgi:hypothetical protein